MKNKKNMEKLKENEINIDETPREAFVDYFNGITEKVQDYTAEKLEKIDAKAKKMLINSKATPQNQARTINNMMNDNNVFKSTTDTILFN